jgi:hypothetical protein
MATKKQKHAQAVAKREAFEAEMRESGLRAQRADQERRDRENRQAWEKQHEKKHFKFVDECPHCQDARKNLQSKKATEAISKMPRPTLRRSPAPQIEEIPDGASMEMECI